MDDPDDVASSDVQKELWLARDQVVMTTRELGELRAKNKELEVLIHQLRMRILSLEGKRPTPGALLDRGLRAIRAKMRSLLSQ